MATVDRMILFPLARLRECRRTVMDRMQQRIKEHGIAEGAASDAHLTSFLGYLGLLMSCAAPKATWLEHSD
jgi:hypothetical protein